MTSDRSGLTPPHELHGPLGQVIDAGGGFVPLLAPAPVPNAVANASPGLSASAVSPGIGPTLPSDDPGTMAILLGRMANEMFAGSSIAPLAPSNVAAAAGGAPASPGISPMLAPGPLPVSGAPSDPTAAAVPAQPVMPPASVVPASSSASFGANPFGPTSFDALPMFGAGQLPTLGLGAAEVMWMPMVEGAAVDAPPSFLPDARALGLETELATPYVVPHELRPEYDTLARDLGGKAFDPYAVRRDFPILEERVHGKRLVWLDNAATTQKPQAVIDRLSAFYAHENSNVHRAAHTLAARATDAYEGARETTRKFLNAPSVSEIVFVRGATEGLNLIAQSWGRRNVTAGDEIVITWLEHHANIVPWQQLCAASGAKLRIAPVDDRGDVILEEYEKLLGPRTKLVSFTQVSNALGTITPARTMIELAHRHGARVVLDGAQAVSHMGVDVQALDCDFYVFSGHKVFAPTGIGAVYGKRDVLEQMPPWQGGGNMIQDVTFERTTYQPPPFRFEAGTGNIADAAGLGAALDYVMRIGLDTIERYEHELLVYATERLHAVPGLRMVGMPREKAGVLSFVLDGQRTEDVGGALDKEGIAVRSGHHCAQPILRRLGLESSVRASLAFYNVCEDIDALVDALMHLQGGRSRPL
jgi:cysteine desulfurase/selenocysteine lyase